MLKWLRKYNTYILVVGGCLLMVAFLLQGVLNDLSKRGLFGGTAFKVGSHKVGMEEFSNATREYAALNTIVDATGLFSGRQGMEALGAGESAEHWYLLTNEAEKAGLVGGPRDGADYLDEIATEFAGRLARSAQDIETYHGMFKTRMEGAIKNAGGLARMTDDEIYKGLAKMRGAVRLQNAYYGAARFSTVRLSQDSRTNSDIVNAEYVLVPAERELADIAEPDEAATKAHYEKYKDTPKGGGDFGIGYKLPARVKLEWLELNRQIISDALTIDDIEVEKRFQVAFPGGAMPTGKDTITEHKRIESEVRKELADKVMKSAEAEVRGQIDKATRKLERDGEYLRLPADWTTTRPDFMKIREVVAARLLDTYKIMIPAPKVIVRANGWIEQTDVAALEGIGSTYLKRGTTTKPFAAVLFSVKEIADANDLNLQTQVPASEAVEAIGGASPTGNKYFFTILDARKESAPDSIEEVRADIVKNIKRLAAYEKLKARESTLTAKAVSEGLEAIAKAPDGSTDQTALPVRPVRVTKKQAGAIDSSLDNAMFRDKVLAVAAAIDPTTDVSKLDAAKKTGSSPIDKSLSLAIFRIKDLAPLTVERFRSQQGRLVRQAMDGELAPSEDEDGPFSLAAMEKRLNVQYEEGRERQKTEKKPKAKKS